MTLPEITAIALAISCLVMWEQHCKIHRQRKVIRALYKMFGGTLPEDGQ